MRDAVLVMEAGVSTVRFAVLDITGADIGDYALRGELTGLYGRARFRVRDGGGDLLADIDCADELPPGHEIGLDLLFTGCAAMRRICRCAPSAIA